MKKSISTAISLNIKFATILFCLITLEIISIKIGIYSFIPYSRFMLRFYGVGAIIYHVQDVRKFKR